MFESRHQPLLPRHLFVRRMLWSLAFAGAILAGALGIGIPGYHFCAGLSWIDAFLNASMILTGMGPVDILTTVSAKLFAGFYALFSGVVFLSVMAVALAPIFHRMLHKFHLAEEDLKGGRH